MLSDEEKKAIESFKEENNNDLSRFDDFNSYTQFKVKRDKLIIALIEKQQKEIENLKEQNKNLNWYFENQKESFVHKDKIKAEIKELKDMKVDGEVFITAVNFAIKELQSLLDKEEIYGRRFFKL